MKKFPDNLLLLRRKKNKSVEGSIWLSSRQDIFYELLAVKILGTL